MNKQVKTALLWLALLVHFSGKSMNQNFKTPIKKSQALLSIGEQQGSPKTITFMVPPRTQIDPQLLPEDMKYLSQAWITLIKKSYKKGVDPRKNSLFFSTPIFIFPALLEELKKAVQHKVNVKILLSPSTFTYLRGDRKDMFKGCSDDMVRVYTSFDKSDISLKTPHAKLFLYSVNGKQGYSIGSSNISAHGLFHNNEITQITDNDPDNYKVLLEDLEEIWRKSRSYGNYLECKDKKIKETVFSPIKLGLERLLETPEKKRTVLTSLEYKLSTILEDRLNPEKFEKNDIVWLSTFTFNSPELTDALYALLDKGVEVFMYVDKDPFNRKDGSVQLKKLYEKGAQIYKYSGPGYRINHAKFMLIQRQGNTFGEKKVISIVSTQNVMKDNKDFDALSIDLGQGTFDTNLKIVKSYEKNYSFKLVNKDAFEEQAVVDQNKMPVNKPTKRRIDFIDNDSSPTTKSKK